MVSANFSQIILLTTLSSGVLPMAYEQSYSIVPQNSSNYIFPFSQSNWEQVGVTMQTSISVEDEMEKTQILVQFANNLLKDSTDMEGNYLKIVEENFWDLV